MGLPLVPKAVTLNDLKRHNGHYYGYFKFTKFGSCGGQLLVTVVEIRPMLSAAKCSPANLVFGSIMIYDDILRNY